MANCWVASVEVLLFLLSISLFSIPIQGQNCNLPTALKDEINSYRPVAQRIIESATTAGKMSGLAYNKLAELTDYFGNRLSGSQALENSIEFMVKESLKQGLENVHTERAMVPHWKRGEESATLLEPRRARLALIGLGMSSSTPPEGITAPIVVVKSFEDLDKVNVTNKIVLLNCKYTSYSVTVVCRSLSAIESAKRGAVGVLVRSIAPFSIRSPHTGVVGYKEGVRRIPAAAVSIEDANMLQRMQNRGHSLRMHLVLNSQDLGLAASRNTVSELQGSALPGKVVLISAHLDSWDVGVGAMDDGGGVMVTWGALALLKRLGLRPRRTIRNVLWTSEEQNAIGSQQYFNQHLAEIDNMTMVFETDMGTFSPTGIDFMGLPQAKCIMQEIMSLLSPINATSVGDSVEGVDTESWQSRGVPSSSIRTQNEKYFWFHHTEGDTMDVQNPEEMDRCTALIAVLSYVVADLQQDLPKKLVL